MGDAPIHLLSFSFDCFIVFIFTTTAFDALHFLLHKWQNSRFAVLRIASRMHQAHHDFLGPDVQIRMQYKWRNMVLHLVPEYLVTILATLACLTIFSPWPVVAMCTLHTVLFAIRLKEEGLDVNHMSMSRLSGPRSLWWVDQSYHALHHVHPTAYFSSMCNIFDLVFGTAHKLSGACIAVTGASGAFGAEMVRQLRQCGAVVIPIGRDLNVDFPGVDILVLAHGAKNEPNACWEANYRTPIELGERFISESKGRLVPPEIWGVGSEAEIYGMSDYSRSKQSFADYVAQNWCHNPDVTYRHIVPAAFRSRMGFGLMSARVAVGITLFFVRRGFSYIPVTYTTLALWNWPLFVIRGRGADRKRTRTA
jgi:hypothetical protein